MSSVPCSAGRQGTQGSDGEAKGRSSEHGRETAKVAGVLGETKVSDADHVPG
jgi:hypothetical protein